MFLKLFLSLFVILLSINHVNAIGENFKNGLQTENIHDSPLQYIVGFNRDILSSPYDALKAANGTSHEFYSGLDRYLSGSGPCYIVMNLDEDQIILLQGVGYHHLHDGKEFVNLVEYIELDHIITIDPILSSSDFPNHRRATERVLPQYTRLLKDKTVYPYVIVINPSKSASRDSTPSDKSMGVGSEFHQDERISVSAFSHLRSRTGEMASLLIESARKHIYAFVTQYGAPWGLDRIDQRSNRLDGQFSPPNGGEDVDIYIIDSGINLQHQEFTGRIVENTNFYPGFTNSDSATNPHGPQVSSVAAGNTFGVAKAARIHSLRVFGDEQAGPLSGVVDAIEYLENQWRDNPPRNRVVNLSLGSDRSLTLNRAVERLVNSGAVVVVAAGNSNEDACDISPASSSKVITVGASDPTDNLADFSNYGKCVDIIAPGVGIPGASTGPPDSAVIMSGTSQASPFVTGAAALYLSQYPGSSPEEVKRALLCSATSGALRGLEGDTPDRLLYIPPGGWYEGMECGAAGSGAGMNTPEFSVAAALLVGIILINDYLL